MLFDGSNLWHNVNNSGHFGERWNLSIFRRESIPAWCGARCAVADALLWHVRLLWSICVQSGRSGEIGCMRRHVGCYSKCDGHIHMVTTARSIGVNNTNKQIRKNVKKIVQHLNRFKWFEYACQLAHMAKMVRRSIVVWFIMMVISGPCGGQLMMLFVLLSAVSAKAKIQTRTMQTNANRLTCDTLPSPKSHQTAHKFANSYREINSQI